MIERLLQPIVLERLQAALARSLGFSAKTVHNDLDLLESLFLVRRLPAGTKTWASTK